MNRSRNIYTRFTRVDEEWCGHFTTNDGGTCLPFSLRCLPSLTGSWTSNNSSPRLHLRSHPPKGPDVGGRNEDPGKTPRDSPPPFSLPGVRLMEVTSTFCQGPGPKTPRQDPNPVDESGGKRKNIEKGKGLGVVYGLWYDPYGGCNRVRNTRSTTKGVKF